jgi:SAM-dependent methyltransferase
MAGGDAPAAPAGERHWWQRGRRRVLGAMLDDLPLPQPAEILDAGRGRAPAALDLAALGRVATLAPSASLTALPFRDARFDLVVCLEAAEHLEDDLAGLAELRRVVRPGGFLLATLPAQPWLWGSPDLPPRRGRRFLRPRLLQTARRAGWRPWQPGQGTATLLPASGPRRLSLLCVLEAETAPQHASR